MKYFFISSLLCIFTIFGYAHQVNRAYFTLLQKENTIEVEAEFPWTMRNVLITFNPALENATNKKDFEDSFVAYIRKNLILKDSNLNTLPYLEFKELDNNGHSHQNNYLIIFKGNDLFSITNTMMFNVFKHQINYNKIIINSEEKRLKPKKNYLVLI